MLLGEDSLQQGGFLARCLFAHSRAEAQHIGGSVSQITDKTRTGWERLIRSLLTIYRQPATLPTTDTLDEPL